MKSKLRASQGMVDYFKTEQESILKESSQKTNIIDKWLQENGNTEIAKQVEEEAKQETTSQETIEQIVNSLSIKDATNLDLFLKGIQHQKEQEGNKYTEDEFLEFSQWVSNEDWVYLPSKGYWVNEEQEELEQKLTTKELFEQFKNK